MSKRLAACDQISGATIASRTMSATIAKDTAPTGLRSAWSQRRNNGRLPVEDRRLRIDHAERDVHDEVDEEHEPAEDQGERLHGRVVPRGDRLDQRRSQARPG